MAKSSPPPVSQQPINRLPEPPPPLMQPRGSYSDDKELRLLEEKLETRMVECEVKTEMLEARVRYSERREDQIQAMELKPTLTLFRAERGSDTGVLVYCLDD